MSAIPKKTPHCMLKIHVDGTCSCTLTTPDSSGKVLGQTSTIEIHQPGGSPIKVVPSTPSSGTKTTSPVMMVLQKIICLQCNTMNDITEDIQTITCKCGHKISVMVKRHE